VWVTSVQIIIFIVTVAVYGIAPVAVQNSHSTQVVTLPCCSVIWVTSACSVRIILKYGDIQNITLTPNKEPNILIY